MDAKTAKALYEMMRCAIKTVTGKEPEGPIVITIHLDREHEWTQLADRDANDPEPIPAVRAL